MVAKSDLTRNSGLWQWIETHVRGGFRGYFIRLNSAPPFKIISKRLFEPLEMGGENKPIFGSTGKTPAVPFVAGGFRQLLFGNSALGRGGQHASLDHR
jgi:hypothetical protein